MSKERFEFLEYRFSHGTCTQEEYAEYKQEVERRENAHKKEYENALLKQENCSHSSTIWVWRAGEGFAGERARHQGYGHDYG